MTDTFTPEIIPNCKKIMLQAIIEGKIDKSAIIYSDGWPAMMLWWMLALINITGSIIAIMNFRKNIK